MEHYTYAVVDERGNTLASGMNIDMACILVRALMGEWYREKQLVLSIRREYQEPVRCADDVPTEGHYVNVSDDGEYYGEDC